MSRVVFILFAFQILLHPCSSCIKAFRLLTRIAISQNKTRMVTRAIRSDPLHKEEIRFRLLIVLWIVLYECATKTRRSFYFRPFSTATLLSYSSCSCSYSPLYVLPPTNRVQASGLHSESSFFFFNLGRIAYHTNWKLLRFTRVAPKKFPLHHDQFLHIFFNSLFTKHLTVRSVFIYA